MVVYRDYDPVRRRVIGFYKKYDPSKLEEIGFVDQVVTKYASEGEKLFSLLVDQYGPEPGKHLVADKSSGASGSSDATVSSKMRVPDGGVSSVTTDADVALKPMAAVALSDQQSLPASLAAPTDRIDIRSRLVRFYEIYDPKQLEEVGFLDKMLETHTGEGEKLFSRLVKEYGPEPGKQSDTAEVSAATVGSDPAVSSKMRVPDGGGVSSATTKAGTALKPMRAMALSEQQPLPALLADTIGIRSRLVRFYEIYNPSQLEEVGFLDKMLDTYASEGDNLFSRLVEQHGPEPELQSDVDQDNQRAVREAGPMLSRSSVKAQVALKRKPAATLSEQQSSLPALAGGIDIRSRLVRFFEIYNPNQLEEIGFLDKMLDTYSSEGEKLFSRLVKQYGPEPGLQPNPDSESSPMRASAADNEAVIAVAKKKSTAGANAASADTGSRNQKPNNVARAKAGDGDVREADTSAKMRRRLELFYAAYNPAKLEEAGFMDNAIQTYADKEEMLFARLVQQYGPEPAASADDSEPFAGSLGVNSEARTEHVSVSVNQHGLKSSSPTKT